MSVEKVNRYKNDKINRANQRKKEKVESTIAFSLVVIISVLIIVWAVFAISKDSDKKADSTASKADTNATTVNIDSINEYVDSLEYFEIESETVEAE